jgi:hypothetical protein
MGIPTVVLTREDFVGVIKNAVRGFGFAPEIAMVTFPIDLFLIESDLSPLAANIDGFIEGLTTWEPTIKGLGLFEPPPEQVEGKDHEEALENINKTFLRNRWGDGLPIIPPTRTRVKRILRGSDLPSETVIGKIMPKGGIATVETLAIALAMTGGRPEYLPVLIAAIRALLEKKAIHELWQATSSSVFPVVIVNGPIGRQIRLNTGFGLLGPDPQHPAGGCIGRAVRFLQQNVGGALPGVGTMSIFGGMRYTNAVFAEDEESLPQGWRPLNVAYTGFPEGTNTVTVATVSGAVNIMRRGTGKETQEAEALTSLHIIAGYLKNFNINSLYGYYRGSPGVLLITGPVANQLADLGWTREKIQEFLWENTKFPLAEIREKGFDRWIKFHRREDTLQDPWPLFSKPENLMIVVAGGRHPTHALWMQSAMAPIVTGKEIEIPKGWDDLIGEAEKDLGPRPAY